VSNYTPLARLRRKQRKLEKQLKRTGDTLRTSLRFRLHLKQHPNCTMGRPAA